MIATQDETHAGSNGEIMTLFLPLACIIGKEFPGHITCDGSVTVLCSVLCMAQPEPIPKKYRNSLDDSVKVGLFQEPSALNKVVSQNVSEFD